MFVPELHQLIDRVTEGRSQDFLDTVGKPLAPKLRLNPNKHSTGFQKALLLAENLHLLPIPGLDGVFGLAGAAPPPGKSLAHFLGDIYLQDLASMLPVAALRPEPGSRILDLCAAPGSKTTQLAERMENRGIIVANDSSGNRVRSLVFNLRRMGVVCAAVTKAHGELFGNHYFEAFDGVLLDAPCSSLGTVHKSPGALFRWAPARTERLASQQRSLLASGLKALRTGGVLVYSTCTITPQENEEIISDALNRFPVQLEEITFPFLTTHPGLTQWPGMSLAPSLASAVRVLPYENNCDGFFVARLRKIESFGQARFRRAPAPTAVTGSGAQLQKDVLGHFEGRFGIPVEFWTNFLIVDSGGILSAASPDLPSFAFHSGPLQVGLPIAQTQGPPARLTTEGVHLAGHAAVSNVECLEGWDQLFTYANREDLAASSSRQGQTIVTVRGEPVGHAWTSAGKLLSRFPRSGWKFGELGK